MPDPVMPPPIPEQPAGHTKNASLSISINTSNNPSINEPLSPADALKKGPPPIPAHLLGASSPTHQPMSPSSTSQSINPSVIPPLSPMSPMSPMTDEMTDEQKEAKRTADRASRRTKLIAEIHETERMYSNSMSKLVVEYLTPLRAHPDRYNVTAEQVKKIFGNIDQISGLHEMFYADLSKRSLPADVCHGFMKFVDFLRMYIPYVNNYTEGSKVLTQLLNENKKFIKLCQEKKQVMGLDLSSYLIQPIQRIPRYELLLKELKRNLEVNATEEHQILDEALSKIQANAQKVNENKRQAERVAALVEIQTRVAHLQDIFPSNQSLNADHRRLVKEGDLFKKSTFSKKARHYYLFNDLVIWTTPKHQYKGHLGVSELKVQPINHSKEEEKEPHSASHQSNNADDALGLELYHPSVKQSFILHAESAYEYKNWLNAFNEAINESQNLDPHLLTWLHAPAINQSGNQRHERMRSVSSNNGSRLSVLMGDLSPLSPMSPNRSKMEEVDEEDEPSVNHSTNRSKSEQEPSSNHSTNQANEFYDNPLEDSRDLDDEAAKNSESTSLSSSQRIVRRPSTISTAPHTRNPSTNPATNVSTSDTSSHTRSMSSIAEITPAEAVSDILSTDQSSSPSGTQSHSSSKTASTTQSTNQSIRSSPTHSRKSSVLKTRAHSRKPSSMFIQVDASSAQPTIPTVDPAVVKQEKPVIPELHIDAVDTVEFALNTAKINQPTKRSLTAAQALASLSRNDVTSLKKLKSPPLPVRLAIEACAVLLGLPPGEPVREPMQQIHQSKIAANKDDFKRPNYWQPVQALLVKPTFMKTLCEFEESNQSMNEETLKLLKQYIFHPAMDPQLVHGCSQPAAILWQWVRSRYAKQTGEELPFNQPIQSKPSIKKTVVVSKIDSGVSSRSTAVSRAVSKRSTPTHSRHASVSVTSTHQLLSQASQSMAKSPRASISVRPTTQATPSATASRIPVKSTLTPKPSTAAPTSPTPRKSIISPRPTTANKQPIVSSVKPTSSSPPRTASSPVRTTKTITPSSPAAVTKPVASAGGK